MSSYWEKLYAKRSREGACIACGQQGHWARSCIYYLACYVCHGRGHKSFDCPTARAQLREEAKRSAETYVSTSSFLAHTSAQAKAHTSVGSSQTVSLMDVDYTSGFRADREGGAYAWGSDPDTFQQPLYVRGLPTFELPAVFQRLLPGDFDNFSVVSKSRKQAWTILRQNIDKMVDEFGYKKEFLVQVMKMADGTAVSPAAPSSKTSALADPESGSSSTSSPDSSPDDVSADNVNAITSVETAENQGDDEKEETPKQKIITTTQVTNPLALASRDNNLGLARALLHYATYGEEATQLIDIVAYNKRGVSIRKNPFKFNTFEITVEGVGEGRPSVLRGDKILLSTGPKSPIHGGIVYFVNQDNLVFSMPSSYNHSPGDILDLIFILPRTQERSYHRALASGTNWFLTQNLCLRDFRSTAARFHVQLTKNTQPNATALTTTTFYDFKIPSEIHSGKALNEKQSEFVAHAVSLKNHVTLLFGPPGTGKTKAMIVAIAELVLACPQARVLVVTPSNEAADLMIERLDPYIEYINSRGGEKITALCVHSLSRANKSVSETVKKYSKPSSAAFIFPTKEEAESHTITVATMMTSDRLNGIGVSFDHFTHVWVDEAGHATESLLALPLSLASAGRCKVVLAGDPKQLGPRIRSQPLVARRVQESTLARLIDEKAVWDQCGVQLVENYRSHPSIIHVVNSFYDNQLIAAPIAHGGRFESDKSQSNSPYSQWSKLPNKDVPILCIDHDKAEATESDSPSWFNQFEVNQVIEHVKSLVFEEKICRIEDIAVITPYTKQVQKISDSLYWMLVHSGVLQDAKPRPPLPIKVATIDSYQGREAEVVILSCVRSNLVNVASDLRFHMGFLSQPQRTNVAMSRARELLIVIGNRQLLSLDPLFGEYFQRMLALGTIVSKRAKETTELRSDMVRQIKSMMAVNDDEAGANHGAHEKAWVRHD